MRIFHPFAVRSAISAAFLLTLPAMALAGGGTSVPASPKAQPVREIKVWTNEDVQALGPRFEPASQHVQTRAAEPAAPSAKSAISAARVEPDQDPRWYAQQLGGLESELTEVSAHEDQLRNFRATSKGMPTGLNVVAPCVGVGTDNLIAQLDARRQEILQQIDAIGDTARTSGMPPGILVEGRGRVSPEVPLTPKEQQAALVDHYRDLSADLDQTQGTVAAMDSDAASRAITLIQPDSRWGGNMTTNMQQNLYNQESELQSQISAIQDEARTSGVTIE